MTTDAATPARNEDAAGALGETAVMLDGAGVPPRFRAGCEHSVAWFSHTLAAQLLLRAQDRSVGLREALAGAIEAVRDLHEDGCDLEAGGPSATVLAVRRAGEHLEHLVLCDSSLLLQSPGGGVERVTDSRIDEVVRSETGTDAIEARRNREGGFWVARHEVEAADEAIIGRTELTGLEAAHLVSDGITRTIDLLGTHTAQTLAADLLTDPRDVIDQLRAHERALGEQWRPRKLHDDATVVTILP